MKYSYIVSDSADPYWNLAVERSLFRYTDEETAILFLWQNDNTIVIGRNQDPYAECRAEEFLASGGRIARRPSGGGAVYHDLGNLNFSILCPEKMMARDEYQHIVKRTLRNFGLEAEFNGRNDFQIQGRKFSGNASYSDGRVLCRHGTILIHTDIEKMEYYLMPSTEKLERNYVRSVKERVVNLGDLLRDVSAEDVKKAMIGAVEAEELKCALTNEEVEKKRDFYKSREWNLSCGGGLMRDQEL